MTDKRIKMIRWCILFVIMVVAVLCEVKIGNSIYNAILDVAVVFLVFYIGQKDTTRKIASLQSQIHELQRQIERFEVDNHNNPNGTDTPNPASNFLWEHAVKR